MLTLESVIPYLRVSGLVTSEHIVAGAVTAIDVSRRNRNFKVVSRHGGPGFLVKQGVDEERRKTVAHEAAMYDFLVAHDESRQLEPLMPRRCLFDQARCVLVLELIDDAVSLAEQMRRRKWLGTRLGQRLGATLATLHNLGIRPRVTSNWRRCFVPSLPFALRLDHLDLALYQRLSRANQQLIGLIQQTADLTASLGELREQWRASTLIHADLRWDNWSLFPSRAGSRRDSLKLVDWELATLGDPCWDVGTVFGEVLDQWLLSTPNIKGLTADARSALAEHPLDRTRPAVAAFWATYSSRAGYTGPQRDECLLRSVRYAGVRLIQTAFDRLQLAGQITEQAVLQLQLGLNVLRRPLGSALTLLGIAV